MYGYISQNMLSTYMHLKLCSIIILKFEVKLYDHASIILYIEEWCPNLLTNFVLLPMRYPEKE